MKDADDLTIEDLRKIAETMDLTEYKKFLNLPLDEMSEKGREILEGIGKKEFLTLDEFERIAQFLPPELWERFKQLPREKRVKTGIEILKKINKGV